MAQDTIEQHVVPYPVLPAGMTDQQFVDLWLRRYKQSTRETYKSAAYRFLFFLEETKLCQVTVDLLLDFEESLGYLGAATKIRIFRTVQSLYHFARGTGYVSLNIGAFIRIPQAKRKLAQRILSEAQVHSIMAQEKDRRNHALLRFLYYSAARVAEVCKLTWRDFQEREEGRGQVLLDGKGEKERVVLLPAEVYQEVLALRTQQQTGERYGDDDPVWRSRGGGRGHSGSPLDRSQIFRIVEAAAVRADVATYLGQQERTVKGTAQTVMAQVTKSRVSPHWFRHAHASHALDRGVPPHVVQETLGHSSLAVTSIYSHARPHTSSALALAV